MATFTHTSGVSVSTDGQETTWSQGNYSQTLGEVAASWSSVGKAIAYLLFWQNYDDTKWENVTDSTGLEKWEDFG